MFFIPERNVSHRKIRDENTPAPSKTPRNRPAMYVLEETPAKYVPEETPPATNPAIGCALLGGMGFSMVLERAS